MARRRRRSHNRRQPVSTPAVILVLMLVLIYYLVDSGELQQLFDLPQPAPNTGTPGAAGDIQVFHTTPYLIYPDTPERRRDSPLLDAVIADIDSATQSVDVAAFDLDLEPLAAALLRAQQRGLKVRVVIDSENLDTPEVAAITGQLQDAGVQVGLDDREPFMHNKFIVIDDAIAWTGSWNLTINDTYRNNNNMVRMQSTTVAEAYTREIEQMLAGQFGTRKTSFIDSATAQIDQHRVTIYFSPQDEAEPYLLDQLAQAGSTIRFMAFSFTSDPIGERMIEKASAGVSVQGVIERRNSGGTGSEYDRLRSAGIDVLEDGNCYAMHHKVIIIDESIVITGSYNFTASAANDNDENVIIIESPEIAHLFLEEYDRVYEQAQTPQRCG